MGSGAQILCKPEYLPYLGHDGIIDFRRDAYWWDLVAGISIGTGTAKTKLAGGGVFGTGADYLIPTDAKCVVAVRPKLMLAGLPTANQSVLATLKVESTALHMGDYEVFASPMGSGLGTAENLLQDPAPIWPLMLPCNGGEYMQFYGTAQVANTVAPLMSCDVYLSNLPPEGYSADGGWRQGYGPVQAKIGGINSGGGPTSTGTAAATPAPNGGTVISAPKKRLIAAVGVVVGTTPAAQKGISGQFIVAASELLQNPLRWESESQPGFLGTTTTGDFVHLSINGPMNLGFKTNPSTPVASFTLDTAITTLANFEVGYLFVDNP
jgi:hypothetical protein